MAVADEPDTYMQPEHGWTCFHCGETFTHPNPARNHFGELPEAKPGCLLRMQPGEQPLLRQIRSLERELSDLRHQVCNEDTEKDREINSMIARHASELREQEEKGYAQGLADGRSLQHEAA